MSRTAKLFLFIAAGAVALILILRSMKARMVRPAPGYQGPRPAPPVGSTAALQAGAVAGATNVVGSILNGVASSINNLFDNSTGASNTDTQDTLDNGFPTDNVVV